MPLYENIYISHDSSVAKYCFLLADDVEISGRPDITLTWVKDPQHVKESIDISDFSEAVSVGEGSYIESLDRLAFHCGRVKLTVVKLNDHEPGKIIIGEHVVLQGTAIVAYQQVIIENHVIFGPNVTVMDSSGHPLRGRGGRDEASRITSAPVHIKEHAWIGMGAVILKGVTIGRHAVVGAGSIVNEDVPDYALALGNPAKVVKSLK